MDPVSRAAGQAVRITRLDSAEGQERVCPSGAASPGRDVVGVTLTCGHHCYLPLLPQQTNICCARASGGGSSSGPRLGGLLGGSDRCWLSCALHPSPSTAHHGPLRGASLSLVWGLLFPCPRVPTVWFRCLQPPEELSQALTGSITHVSPVGVIAAASNVYCPFKRSWIFSNHDGSLRQCFARALRRRRLRKDAQFVAAPHTDLGTLVPRLEQGSTQSPGPPSGSGSRVCSH